VRADLAGATRREAQDLLEPPRGAEE
jgi:hypothetical protein